MRVGPIIFTVDGNDKVLQKYVDGIYKLGEAPKQNLTPAEEVAGVRYMRYVSNVYRALSATRTVPHSR